MIENDACSIYSLFIEIRNTVYEEQSFVVYLNDCIVASVPFFRESINVREMIRHAGA